MTSTRRRLPALATWLLATCLCAQNVLEFRQHNMKKWGIPAGNYSGIAPIGGDRYALISDKQTADGWTEVSISFLPSGDIGTMRFVAHHFDARTSGHARDSEGIVCLEGRSFFVSAENDQQVVELDGNGTPTGRRLAVPACFSTPNIFANYGFEALTYQADGGIFWTTTEQGLKTDAAAPVTPDDPSPALLRLQSFGPDLQPLRQYAYSTELPATKRKPRYYAFGVPELLAVDDSTLIVMERELNIPRRYNRAKCRIRLFRVNPHSGKAIADTSLPLREAEENSFLTKTPLHAFSTGIRLFGKKNFANYEGMCLGPKLPDGRQTILLVADSQNRSGNSLFRLKDYIKVLVFRP